ncbi:MAG: DUF1566 domain-containing protein [Deltaproteobacteria bacterium]|nr:DUF1566 domain-containing protein [Deltaproteobacteria bacterium]
MSRSLPVFLAAALVLFGCHKMYSLDPANTGIDGGGGSDMSNSADADADADMDSDADTDTDSDADSDTDADTDMDADTETDTDADADVKPSDCVGARYDASSGLCWQHPAASDRYEWQSAIDYCDSLDLGGHTDWVLPTRQNLIDLLEGCNVDVLAGGWGYCNSCAKSATCKELFGLDNNYYWSSSLYGDDTAYFVYFWSGAVSYGSKPLPAYTRCVRSVL